MRLFLFSALLITMFVVPGVARATDTNVNYGFYGPAGNYKIELFEVRAAYPSRQEIVNGYTGQYTYNRTWYAIVAYRSYFIRITNTQTGVAKQTRAVWVTYVAGGYPWGTCNWYSM